MSISVDDIMWWLKTIYIYITKHSLVQAFDWLDTHMTMRQRKSWIYLGAYKLWVVYFASFKIKIKNVYVKGVKNIACYIFEVYFLFCFYCYYLLNKGNRRVACLLHHRDKLKKYIFYQKIVCRVLEDYFLSYGNFFDY